MKAETKISLKDYVKIMFYMTYTRPLMIVLLSLMLIFFISFIALPGDNDTFPMFTLFVVIILLPVLTYFSAKKNYSNNLRIQEKICYDFTEDKIIIQGESFYSEMDWNKIYKVVELKNWILLYQSGQSANLILKSSFGNDLEAFKALVKSKGVKAKLKK